MADFYIWSDAELGLNVREMDKEHQELVLRMNDLYNGVENKVPTKQVQALIDSLAQYTVKHFTDEEAYMEKLGFPGLPTHKIIHQQLLTQFGNFVEEFKKTSVVTPAFFEFLKVWLTSHIKGIDKKYSEFTQAKKAA